MVAIIIRGKESIKKSGRKDVKVVPFVGADHGGPMSRMGVGILYPRSGEISLRGNNGPHDLVASYRAMRIAEEVTSIGSDTLSACKYASQREVLWPHEKRDIKREEGLADIRARVFDEQLPSFDQAINEMQDRGINLYVPSLLDENARGFLAMTHVLEKTINDYSDKYLLLCGLSPEYRKAYKHLSGEAKGLLSRIGGAVNHFSHLQAAVSYVGMIEGILPTLISDIEAQSGLLAQSLGDMRQDIGDRLDIFSTAIEQNRADAHENLAVSAEALETLKGMAAAEALPAEKFVAYHKSLDAMFRAASDMEGHLSTLSLFTGTDAPAGVDLCSAAMFADGVIRVINRAAREYMQGAYSLR